MTELPEWIGDYREAYGFPRDGGPLTLDQMKEGELNNALRAAEQLIEEHQGLRDLNPGDYFKYWLKRPTHDRDLPVFAWHTLGHHCYTNDGIKDLVSDAWNLPEFPEGNYGTAIWHSMFDMSGPIHCDNEGIRALEVTEVPTLYRGAIQSRRRGMAWTSDRDKAEWFAKRLQIGHVGGHVWRLDKVPVDRVFARFDTRNEDEWVIDIRRLVVKREDDV